MKKSVRIAAVLLSLALAFGIFAGCGPHTDDPETTPAQEPKKDTLKVFTLKGPTGLGMLGVLLCLGELFCFMK